MKAIPVVLWWIAGLILGSAIVSDSIAMLKPFVGVFSYVLWIFVAPLLAAVTVWWYPWFAAWFREEPVSLVMWVAWAYTVGYIVVLYGWAWWDTRRPRVAR